MTDRWRNCLARFGSGRLWKAAILAGACLLAAVASIPSQAADSRFVRLVDSPYPPYIVGNYGQNPTGSYVELVSELFRRLGMPVEIEIMPWKRAVREARLGRADALMIVFKSREREAYLTYTDEVFTTREILLFDADRLGPFIWDDFADLKGYCVGLVSDYSYLPNVVRAVEQHNLRVEYASDSRTNMLKLVAGRIDFVVEEEQVARSLLMENASSGRHIKAASKIIGTRSFHMAFSKRSAAAALIPDINRELAAMKADGVIERILQRSSEDGYPVVP